MRSVTCFLSSHLDALLIFTDADATDMIQWEEEEGSARFLKRKQLVGKRSREASTVSSDGQGSRMSEMSDYSDHSLPKRIKQEPDRKDTAQCAAFPPRCYTSDFTHGVLHDSEEPMLQFETSDATALEHVVPRPVHHAAPAWKQVRHNAFRACGDENHPSEMGMATPAELQVPHPLGFNPGVLTSYQDVNYGACSDTTSPLTTSFGSVHSDQDYICDPLQMQDAPNAFPGKQNFTFHQPGHGNNTIQAYHVIDVPQPQFETVPNTPGLSPANLYHRSNPKTKPGFNYNPYGVTGIPASMSIPQYSMSAAFAPGTEPSRHFSNGQHAPSHFIPESQFQPQPPSHSPQLDCYGGRHVGYHERYIHGLPTPYSSEHPAPLEHCSPLVFPYPEAKPDANFPATALPGSVIRGFTGHGNGVGKS